MAVSDAASGTPDQVLENIAKSTCSSSAFQGVQLTRLSPQRDDFLSQAEESLRMMAIEDVKLGAGARNLLLVSSVEKKDTTSILDSGSSRHLVTTVAQLHDPVECDEECSLPNGGSMRMQIKGSATFKACVDGEVRQVTLREVYYAENLPWNSISYGKIEEIGYDLCYDGPKPYFGRRSNGCKVFDVHKDASNVSVVKVVNAEAKKDIDYVTMAR
uniref:Uncharacterized protein AlNc14C580G12209 n=1 Tax=Albugo laibachii Nc14 TaxID=890382 RepID=F0X1B8_9STRA|nr:conserved hypothetical protein [Albugo laibachii Nc14]|eukprot:CCA27594.1 conserved hypothetical protein [Albugo laibachii Nc14]